jgi:molybdate transport system substrate-binding protein
MVLLAAFALPAAAEPLTLAVASNFSLPAQELATRFEGRSGIAVRIVAGSTGKLYAQIINGAPFDIFLAADAERPRLLEESGHGVAGSRFTYAIGGLVLWSRDPALADGDCRAALDELGARKLAIANPLTAPYGIAAREFLESINVWDDVQPQLVYGENIAQTLQFAATGNASLGLIASSHALVDTLPQPSCHWPVPASSHLPLEQQAILLHRAADNTVAHEFLRFLRDTEARDIIASAGYAVTQ